MKRGAGVSHVPSFVWTRRLRFPYLKEGDTAAKRDGLRAWMQRHGYAPAPVSVDTSEGYCNEVYLEGAAPPDADRLRTLRDLYVRHIADRARYYDTLAQRVRGRSPPHVLLLQVNAINAQRLPDVLQGLRQDGWHLVTPAQAFADPLYAAKPDVLPAGGGHRLVDGQAGRPDEPAVPRGR